MTSAARSRPKRGVWLAGVAGCLGALLTGCFDGNLDTFELVSARGGEGASGPLLLDDFEDGDNNAAPDGWWYGDDDGTGPTWVLMFDAISGREPSRVAAHLTAGPTTGYGSFLGLDVPGAFIDLSSYSTLTFWARMEPAGELSVRFQSPRSVQYAFAAELDGAWREYRLPITEFRTSDGEPIDLNDGLAHLQFWLADTRPAYHLYVDDVWLLRDP